MVVTNADRSLLLYMDFQSRQVYSYFFFSSRRRHTRFDCDWSSDVCSSDLIFYPTTGNFIGFVGNLRSRSLLRRALSSFRAQEKIPSEGAALPGFIPGVSWRSEEHTSELQSQSNLVCRLLLEKKKKIHNNAVETQNHTLVFFILDSQLLDARNCAHVVQW